MASLLRNRALQMHFVSVSPTRTTPQAAGYQKNAMIPRASPPNVFIGGPVPNLSGFPLKACGNDGLRIGDLHNTASCGELNVKMKFIRAFSIEEMRKMV